MSKRKTLIKKLKHKIKKMKKENNKMEAYIIELEGKLSCIMKYYENRNT